MRTLGRRPARPESAAGLLGGLLRATEHLRAMQDSAETNSTVCREGAGLVDAEGALLYLAGPGRLIAVARHGATPQAPRSAMEVDPSVERAVRDSLLEVDDATGEMVVPIVGEGAAVGAIALYGVGRPDPARADAARLFGYLAGSVFERFGYVIEEGDRDPLTGVGDHRRAAAALASVRPGDAVVVCELDGIGALRAQDPRSADLAQGELGLHLRTTIRPGDAAARTGDHGFVLVLRQLRAPVEVVVGRVLGSWAPPSPGLTVSVGAALHLDPRTPGDTGDLAREMFAAARSAGNGNLYVAPVRR